MFYQFKPATKLPTPGAMSMGLVTEWLAHQAWIGPGIGYRFQWRNFAAQNVQQVSVAVTSGLGGVAHGQLALQPLSDPYGDGT